MKEKLNPNASYPAPDNFSPRTTGVRAQKTENYDPDPNKANHHQKENFLLPDTAEKKEITKASRPTF